MWPERAICMPLWLYKAQFWGKKTIYSMFFNITICLVFKKVFLSSLFVYVLGNRVTGQPVPLAVLQLVGF